MSAQNTFESQLAGLIAGYADAAPTDVDPLATARFARAAASRRSVADWFTWVDRTLAVGLGIVLLMLTFIAGATVGGPRVGEQASPATSPSSPPQSLMPAFFGLPPADAVPSSPMTGLYVAGVVDIHPWYAAYAYVDGRFISSREYVSGQNLVTTGWHEQHLSQEGVDLLRSGSVGLPIWGELESTAWMPPNGWADAGFSAYVPARFAACLWYDLDPSPEPIGILDLLPLEARALLLGNALRVYETPGGGRPGPMRCYDLATSDARALDEILSEIAIRISPATGEWIEYHLGGRITEEVWFFPLLPNGMWSISGG